jgi:5-methyltetrahydrofolate--homocysteine methyltransferase
MLFFLQAVASVPKTSLRVPPPAKQFLRLSGMTHFDVTENVNFVNIGERCNVAGSRAFLNTIKKNDFEGAVAVARKQVSKKKSPLLLRVFIPAQVESGAQLLDVNFDEGMLDGPAVMERFLNKLSANPDIAALPIVAGGLFLEWFLVH